MTDFKKQRICIQFCFSLLKKLLQKPTECYRKPLEIMPWAKTKLLYGTNASRTDECSGRPSTSTTPANIVKVHEAILADHRQTIHNVCEIVGLSYGTIQHVFVDKLNMRRISARFVPRLLSDNQKAHCISVCVEFKQQARDNPIFISSIITVMKHGCMVMTLTLSSSPCSGSHQIHHSQKKRSSSQQGQVHVDRFFQHPRHCPQGIHTPWSNHQWQVLLWGFEVAEGGHTAQMSRQVEEKQLVSPPWQCACSHITCCSTFPDFQRLYSDSPPSYSPDLALCEFFLFHKMKLWLKGRHFDTTWGSPHRIARDYGHTRIWELPGMHEIMGNMLGSLYMPKGTTSKEAVETRSYGKKLVCGQIPRIFG